MPSFAARPAARPAVDDYVRARLADADGQTQLAADGYGAALALSPGDQALALRTYRQAMFAGDRPLALRAARILDAGKTLPPDGRLLFLADAVIAKDYRGASVILDGIEKEGFFAFAIPVLRAWIALGTKAADPLAILDAPAKIVSPASAYAAEHRAYLLLATGHTDEGIVALQAIAQANAARAARLHLAGAAILGDVGSRDLALSLLTDDDPVTAVARARLNARRPLPGAIDTPADGIGALFVRIGVDVNRDRVTPLALMLARLATFLSPGNAETWLVTSDMLTNVHQYDAAGAALDQVRADDPFAGLAAAARVQLLARRGEPAEALTQALAAANGRNATSGDWKRVGDLYGDAGRHADAAKAYDQALALMPPADPARWGLLMLRGGALDRAGDWPAAKASLEQAVKLAPDQPVVLNYLGYAQLQRRENLAGAESLIERASLLSPDDAAITDSLGWTYFVRGNLTKAVATLERAAAAEPGEPEINEHLGDAYWATGRRFEARYAWRAALVHAEPADAVRIARKLDQGYSAEVAAR